MAENDGFLRIVIPIIATVETPSTQIETTLASQNISTSENNIINDISNDIDFISNEPLADVPVPYKSQKAFSVKNIEEINLIDEPLTYNLDLKKLLEESAEGRYILESSGNFDEKIRNSLATIIINNELKHDITSLIPTDRFKQLARLIKRLFPHENIGVYYTPFYRDKDGKFRRCARGKLFDKYHNLRRKFRSINKENQLNASNSNAKLNDSECDNNSDTENSEILSWLEFNSEPWTEVLQKWKSTTKIRQRILEKDFSENVDGYLKKFSCFFKPLGFTLIEVDFNNLYEDYTNKFFYEYPIVCGKIMQIANKAKKLS